MRAIAIAALVTLAACSQEPGQGTDAEAWEAPPARFGTTVHTPHAFLGFTTSKRNLDGQPIRVKCETCHRVIVPDEKNTLAHKLERFHVGVDVSHGDLTCRSCHNAPAYQDFRLVTGRTVSYTEVMELCGQCHGQQLAEYRHGAHGGMAGYWDLSRGPRDKNHCIDCHRPHDPAIRQVTPAPKARYRFTDAEGRE